MRSSRALLADDLSMRQDMSAPFRRPVGGKWSYSASGGGERPPILNIFVTPPRPGKTVLANTIDLGLCHPSAGLAK